MLKIKPIRVHDEARAVRFFRVGSTTDLHTILQRGIHQKNEMFSTPDQVLDGTNFLGLGSSDNPSFQARYQEGRRGRNLQANPNFVDPYMRLVAQEHGYALAMYINVTERNFPIFQGKIGEKENWQNIDEPWNWKNSFKELQGGNAIIRTDLISVADIIALGDDVQIGIFKRKDVPRSESEHGYTVTLRSFADVYQELEQETRREMHHSRQRIK